jgi:hypothetical protein
MACLRMRYPEHRQSMRLLLVGGVRNEADSKRVEELKELADSLQVSVCRRPSPIAFLVDRLIARTNRAGIRRVRSERAICAHFGTPRRGEHRAEHDGG